MGQSRAALIFSCRSFLLASIGVGRRVPIGAMIGVMVMPPRVIVIIIASFRDDIGITATTGDKETETAEDEENSGHHGGHSSCRGTPHGYSSCSPAAAIAAFVFIATHIVP
jgi:hypothetical protein